MDFVPCGDLHSIIKHRKLKESEVLFYVGEAILALNAVHTQNYIYRDLKPENLLLDLDGHIHLTDFGLAKKVSRIDALNYSQCGTLQVMAPEIFNESGYSCTPDYYNIGTLTYELATGRVPVFTEKHRVFLEDNNPALDNLSDELQDFIKRLLDHDPARRLGAKSGLREIAAHPWIASLDLVKLYQRKISPPLLFDPSTIKFQPKSSVPASIDATDQKYSTTEPRYIPNISYDELGFAHTLVKLDLAESNNLMEKGSKTATLSTCAGSTTSSPSIKSKIIGSSPKINEEITTENDDFEVGEEFIDTNFDHYKSLNIKSMKVLTGPKLILKS